MKTLTAAQKTLPQIQEAIDAAQAIGRALHALQNQFAQGEIDGATFKKSLETLHRHNANELVAMIANLSYEVRS